MHIDSEREQLPWIQRPAELTDCDREPIHTPSAIQPGGALVAARIDDLRVVYASENVPTLLGIELSTVFGQSISELLGPPQTAAILSLLEREAYSPANIVTLTFPFRAEMVFDVTAHQFNGILCVELEPVVAEENRGEALNDLQRAIGALREQRTTHQLCDTAATQLRNLTGYDRVMVYRFNSEGFGEVVAESRADDLEPFLGLHYPASDIPSQARGLYLVQRQRAITAARYVPVRIVANPELDRGEPMDMTHCALRSVSPLHLEYLRNMGVEASFSISLIDDRGLWGMILCHHRRPKRPSASVRSLADLLGQLTSLLLGIVGRSEEYAERRAAQECIDRLAIGLDADGDVADALGEDDSLLACVGADGACARVGGRHLLFGATPPIEDVEALIAALRPKLQNGVFATDGLGALLPEFARLAHVASGVLMISVDNEPGDGVIWFRREAARTVRWAGDPERPKEVSAETGLLAPRKSFAEWKTIQMGSSLPWRPAAQDAAGGVRRALTSALLHRATRERAKQSRHDALTGLPNRRVLLEELSAWEREHPKDHAALFFLDVDNFKTVNDSLGHAQGDQLLIQVSQRIRACADFRHLVARLGGDEFVIFCKYMEIGEARALGTAIIERFAEPFTLDGKPFRTTTSVGITAVGSALQAREDPLRAADCAMYVSKHAGGNQASVYEPLHLDDVVRRLQLEQSLFQALDNGEMSVHYQPQIDLATRRLTGFEALLRWRHPVHGAVAPLEFIPMAERLGIIPAIGGWVLGEALRQIKTWREQFNADLTISVNASPKQVFAQDFVDTIREALEATAMPPSALCIEVTESILVGEEGIARLELVRALGVHISVDDFGTGYSSLAYLQSLPIDEVKLDKLFLRGLGDSSRKSALMGAIIHMAHSLNLKVIAEGIESAPEEQGLVDLLCDGAQGYFFSRPMAAADVEAGDIFAVAAPKKRSEPLSRQAQRTYPAFVRTLVAAVENAPDVVMITEAEPVDQPGPRIVYVNKAFEAMTGYACEDVIGETPRILQGPESDREALGRIRQALKSLQPARERLVNYRKDGSAFHVDMSILPIRNASGWITHWVSWQREIAEESGIGSQTAVPPPFFRPALLQ